MATILVHPAVNAVGDAHCRKQYRLVAMAWIARDMGHEVYLVQRPTRHRTRFDQPPYGFADVDPYKYVKLVDDMQVNSEAKAEVYLCTSDGVAQAPRGAAVVAFKYPLGLQRDKTTLPYCDVHVCYAWHAGDWAPRANRGFVPLPESKPEKILQQPWRPHQWVTMQLDHDGLGEAFLRDDVEAIRKRYGSETKKRRVGFIGNTGGDPERNKVIGWWREHHPDIFEAYVTGTAERNLRGQQYLRWLSECEYVLNLPGDTWTCSRFTESCMIGVPTFTNPSYFKHWEKPPTALECLSTQDWKEDCLAHVNVNTSTIVTHATEAYRQSWSLRGLFKSICHRLGI